MIVGVRGGLELLVNVHDETKHQDCFEFRVFGTLCSAVL
jgi:hypothetical protein